MSGVVFQGSIHMDLLFRDRVLGRAWAPQFVERAIDDDLADSFLREHAEVLPWRWANVISKEAYRQLIKILRDSATGKDGIPFSCWHAIGEAAIDVLYDCGEELASGLAPPIWYNDSLSAFLLKKPPEAGSSQIVVEHTDMRLLFA